MYAALQTGTTALIAAAHYDHVEVLRELLAAGAVINTRSAVRRQTPKPFQGASQACLHVSDASSQTSASPDATHPRPALCPGTYLMIRSLLIDHHHLAAQWRLFISNQPLSSTSVHQSVNRTQCTVSFIHRTSALLLCSQNLCTCLCVGLPTCAPEQDSSMVLPALHQAAEKGHAAAVEELLAAGPTRTRLTR